MIRGYDTPQSAAVKMYPDDVPDEVKRDRLGRVLNLQNEISLRINKEKIGSTEEILVEGPSKLRKEQVMGRTRTNKVVNVVGPESLSGKIAQVRITGASANSLLGELAGGNGVFITLEPRGTA